MENGKAGASCCSRSRCFAISTPISSAFALPASTKRMWTVLALALLLPAHGLIVPAAAPPRTVARAPTPTMNIFKNAFANDAAYSKKENAGLSKQAAQKTITWIGPKGQKKTATVVPGQRLKDVARACGIPIRVRRRPATGRGTASPKIAPAAPRRACARLSPPPAPRAAVRLPGRHLQDVRGAVRDGPRQNLPGEGAGQGRHDQIQHPGMSRRVL